jgi:hypothetical protein
LTAPLLSRELVDVSDQCIWRFLREQKIDLAARKLWCQTDDPDFVAKAAEIVGLYLAAGCHRPGGRRKAAHPGAGARPGPSQAAQRASAQRSQSRLQA